MRYNILCALTLAGLLVFAGCDGVADLDVENPNAPDAERAIADPSDLVSVVRGGYTSFWDGTYFNDPFAGIYSSAPHFDGWGDAMTTTNAYAGFWTMAVDEPRVEFQNTLSFADLTIVEVPWQNLNAAISSANDAIRQIEGGSIEETSETQTALAGAYFLRGLSYGYLANIFDRAYITTQEFDAEEDLEDLEFSPHPDVLAQAVSDLQRAREIAENNTIEGFNFLPFTNPVDSGRLIALANSFEARFIVSNPRTPEENEAIDWNRIETLTSNGITEDLVMDLNANPWVNGWQYLSGNWWYWRVDNRIIHRMDPDYPIKYPADRAGDALPPAQSDDQRLCPASGDEFEGSGVDTAVEEGCYFVYDTDQSAFNIERGPTLQSNYWYGRDFIVEQYFNQPFGAGPGPIFLAEENRLMQAEAELRTGNKGTAITLINEGSRVNIGELEPLENDASEAEVLDAIYYERDIELFRTGLALPYFDLRRQGKMQAGTPLHLPVPATELQTVGEDIYTFGGVSSAGQPGTASGDNAWCDEGDLSCDGPFEAPSSSADQSPKSIMTTPMHELGLTTPSFQPPQQ